MGIDDDFVNGLDSEFFYYYGGEGHDTVLGSAKSDLVFGAAFVAGAAAATTGEPPIEYFPRARQSVCSVHGSIRS